MRKEKKKSKIKYFVDTLENPLRTRLSFNIQNHQWNMTFAKIVFPTVNNWSVASSTILYNENNSVSNIPCARKFSLGTALRNLLRMDKS